MHPTDIDLHDQPKRLLRLHAMTPLALVLAIGLADSSSVFAGNTDLAPAEQLLQASKYQEAYDLLLPQASQNTDNAAFSALLGESALRTNRDVRALARQ